MSCCQRREKKNCRQWPEASSISDKLSQWRPIGALLDRASFTRCTKQTPNAIAEEKGAGFVVKRRDREQQNRSSTQRREKDKEKGGSDNADGRPRPPFGRVSSLCDRNEGNRRSFRVPRPSALRALAWILIVLTSCWAPRQGPRRRWRARRSTCFFFTDFFFPKGGGGERGDDFIVSTRST